MVEKTFQIKIKWIVIACIIILVFAISSGVFLSWKSKDNAKKAELAMLQQSFSQQVGTKARNIQFGKQVDIYWATFDQDGINYLTTNIAGIWKVYVQSEPQTMPASTPTPSSKP